MECHYPCARPPPACGHASTPHSCHADTVPCPPCVHLASKECACGKKVVPNVRCSLETEKISCGTVCGKLMACGFHLCQRLCHGDACGGCTAPCGKTRKSWCAPTQLLLLLDFNAIVSSCSLPNNHPCTRPCHAPSGCPGTEPCEALITLSCPCGRIRQPVHCGKSVTSRGSESTQALIKCSTDCQIAKRNARLADALGISPETQNKASATATYNDDVVAFARANSKFLPIVERAFAECVLVFAFNDYPLTCGLPVSSRLKNGLRSFRICLKKDGNSSTTYVDFSILYAPSLILFFSTLARRCL